uniref:Uncharacterized protein n=1 Tax=Rhizophora mucronata TaxID=61149 RepID=A0A2P2QUK8_RHIMU
MQCLFMSNYFSVQNIRNLKGPLPRLESGPYG